MCRVLYAQRAACIIALLDRLAVLCCRMACTLALVIPIVWGHVSAHGRTRIVAQLGRSFVLLDICRGLPLGALLTKVATLFNLCVKVLASPLRVFGALLCLHLNFSTTKLHCKNLCAVVWLVASVASCRGGDVRTCV